MCPLNSIQTATNIDLYSMATNQERSVARHLGFGLRGFPLIVGAFMHFKAFLAIRVEQ